MAKANAHVKALSAYVELILSFLAIIEKSSLENIYVWKSKELSEQCEDIIKQIKALRGPTLFAGVRSGAIVESLGNTLRGIEDHCSIYHRQGEESGNIMSAYEATRNSLKGLLRDLQDLYLVAIEGISIKGGLPSKPADQSGKSKQIPNVSKTRRTRKRKPTPLTDGQRDAYTLVGRHGGDIAAAAEEAGVSRQAMEKRYKKACKKIVEATPPKGRGKTQRLPEDERGQANIS